MMIRNPAQEFILHRSVESCTTPDNNGSEIVLLDPINPIKINIMRSRILKAVVAMVAPLVIEFIVKKISEKIDQKSQPKEPKKLPAPTH